MRRTWVGYRISQKADPATCGNNPPGGCRMTCAQLTLESEVRGTEDAMFGIVLTWVAAVAGLVVLALMALSGVIVDSQQR
ncbi:hypothetical protein FKR81_07375 [Lentzea tibetensis]|uniref:Uncharacterized protein n=1 Tax=Lentzea tibetensis TaxID=2591470 RepID=A0A563EZ73_9PSEU|nr:hypothetical protein FKR81_07375 [Lentzea tibetensis]